MIGLIITGHGGFAAGMEANVKMLAGSDAEVTAIDFADGMTVEELESKQAAAMEKYASLPYTLVLADIAGGTPYNRAATLSVGKPNVRVISGVNASMLMDLAMRNIMDEEVDDIDALVDEVIETARENMGKFVLDVPQEDDLGDEDGI